MKDCLGEGGRPETKIMHTAQTETEQAIANPLPAADDALCPVRHDWQHNEVLALLQRPLMDAVFHAQSVHRQCFTPNRIQLSTLVNIKAGGCPEDCAYCPQSVHYQAGVKAEALMSLEELERQALAAREQGATRFCMGAAWRSPKARDMARVAEMIQRVRALGMETCATLGMLSRAQAEQLQQAGLDYYNHNLDTSPEYYSRIISTREYQDRLDTLRHVRDAGIRVCCGGIIGMGESLEDRASLLRMLANLPQHPESVPINRLVKVEGTPLSDSEEAEVDPFDFVRLVATARIMMPHSWVRLSAGRHEMNDELQALCFLAGANSVFFGDRLLTVRNLAPSRDHSLLARLGVVAIPGP